jgi:hypothetical protein
VALDGEPVTFAVKVYAPVPFNGTPFGTVALSLGGAPLGTAAVDAQGLATFTSGLPLAAGAAAA